MTRFTPSSGECDHMPEVRKEHYLADEGEPRPWSNQQRVKMGEAYFMEGALCL